MKKTFMTNDGIMNVEICEEKYADIMHRITC